MGVFQIALAVFVFEVEELEEVRVADLIADGDGVLGSRHLSLLQHSGLALGEGRPLKEERRNLAVELSH